MLCTVCRKGEANKSSIYGLLPCDDCQKRRSKQPLPQSTEIIPESLRNDRKEHARSILQPYRNGQLSKEFIDTYGTEFVKASPEEIKNAKPQYRDIYSENFDIKKTI